MWFFLLVFIVLGVGLWRSIKRANRRNMGYVTNFHVDTRMPFSPSFFKRRHR